MIIDRTKASRQSVYTAVSDAANRRRHGRLLSNFAGLSRCSLQHRHGRLMARKCATHTMLEQLANFRIVIDLKAPGSQDGLVSIRCNKLLPLRLDRSSPAGLLKGLFS